MKKFLAMLTMFAILGGAVIGCGDDKEKAAKEKAAKEKKEKEDKEKKEKNP